MLLEALFALVVAAAMPLRAWRRHGRQAPPAPAGRYVAESLLLTGALAALLWRRDVPLEALGLVPASWLRLLADTAICVAAIAGPDAWSAWRISRRSDEAASLPPPAGLAADALAGGRSLASSVPVALAGAVWEELCFRATVFLLVPATPGARLLGVAAGSLAFGAQHLRGGVTSMAHASIFGVVFSALYLATGDLVAVVVAHAAGNILTAACWAPWIERSRQEALRRRAPIFVG